jgi:hypothetical protein
LPVAVTYTISYASEGEATVAAAKLEGLGVLVETDVNDLERGLRVTLIDEPDADAAFARLDALVHQFGGDVVTWQVSRLDGFV